MGNEPVVRAATASDWPALHDFYLRNYRPGTPLADLEWWQWRFGDPSAGQAFIVVDEERVVAHLGIATAVDVHWAVNLFIEESHRGKGIAHLLYARAAEPGTLATTNVNKPGIDMYRLLGWRRLADLQRFVAWNADEDPGTLHDPVVAGPIPWPKATGHHYWRQPGISGHVSPDGSTVVDALASGGLRVVEFGEPTAVIEHAFSVGARWLDYITSWNDPHCRNLEDLGWKSEFEGPVDWLLSPRVPGSRAAINVFAHGDIPADRVIRRWDGDHGRVGSR